MYDMLVYSTSSYVGSSPTWCTKNCDFEVTVGMEPINFLLKKIRLQYLQFSSGLGNSEFKNSQFKNIFIGLDPLL